MSSPDLPTRNGALAASLVATRMRQGMIGRNRTGWLHMGLRSTVVNAMHQTSLGARAALLVATVFALSFGAAAIHVIRLFEERFIELAGQHQLAMLRAQADNLNSRLAGANSVLSAIAKLIDAGMVASPEATREFLASRVFLNQSFELGLTVFDRQGRVLLQHSRNAPPAAIDPREQALAQGTLETGQARISAPFPSRRPLQEPAIAMSAPLLDSKGRVIGALQGSLALLSKNFAGDLQRYRIGKSGYLFMTTGDRIMLMHPDPKRWLQVAAHPRQNKGYDRAIDERFEGTTETVNSSGQAMLATFVRLPLADWILGASYPMAEVKEPFWRSLDALGRTAIVAIVLLMLAVGLTVHRLMRPIHVLTEHLVALGQGSARPIAVHSTGEVRVMADAYNHMLTQLGASEEARLEGERKVRRLNASLEQRVLERTLALEQANAEMQQMLDSNARMRKELVHSEKLAALGRLVAGLAHELSTPLGNARMVASSLRERTLQVRSRTLTRTLGQSEFDDYDRYCTDACELMERNLARAANLVQNFKQVAVDQTAERRREFDLRQTIEEIVATLEHLIRHRPLRLHLDLAPDLVMNAYPGSIGQVITNLFTNALDHAFTPESRGEIQLSSRADGIDGVMLEFRDNGRGIPPDDLDSIFDPFFTTRLGHGGTGLGLSIVHNIITGVLGGKIEVRSELGQGTAFIIRLPKVSPQFNRAT